jgi:hypothetical protein
MEQHVMPACCGYFAGPLGLDLTDEICQVKTMARVVSGTLADDLDQVDRRHRDAAQQGDQLDNRGNAEDLDAFNEFRLSGLAQSPWSNLPAGLPESRTGFRVMDGGGRPTRVPPEGLCDEAPRPQRRAAARAQQRHARVGDEGDPS